MNGKKRLIPNKTKPAKIRKKTILNTKPMALKASLRMVRAIIAAMIILTINI
jgi:hypothetical protein